MRPREMSALPAIEEPYLPRVCAEQGADCVRRALLSTGAVVVEGAASHFQIARTERALARYFERTPEGEGLFLGRKTRRFSGLLAKAPLTAELAIDALVLNVVESVLQAGPAKACDVVQLNLTQAVSIGPGERAQILHRDDTAFPFAHEFELMVNAMWPLDCFTIENGATSIVPFSHRWERSRRPEPSDAVAATASPGSAILWLGSVFHGGGANRSQAPRRGLIFSYSLGWLAQAEKLLLSTPPEIARTLPERAQRLIGYQVHRPNLGWIEERDPLEWLNGEVGALAAAQDHFTPELSLRLETAIGRET